MRRLLPGLLALVVVLGRTASGQGAPPANFFLVSPADATSPVSLTPTLTWEESLDAASYTVLVADDDSFVGLVVDTVVTGTSYVVATGVLSYDVTYFWMVTAHNGNGDTPCNATFTFTTEVDTYPPFVVSTTPQDGQTDVSVSTVITIRFNEPLDESTVWDSVIVVPGGLIPGTVAMSDDRTIVFTPTNDFVYETTYTVTVLSWVVDVWGNAMEMDYTFTFTTAEATSSVLGAGGCAPVGGVTAFAALTALVLATAALQGSRRE